MRKNSGLNAVDRLTHAEQRLNVLETAPQSRGKSFMRKHLLGSVLPKYQALTAKCCDCMGDYIDGRVSCGVPLCPLFPHMPYRNKKEVRDGSNNSLDD